MENKFQTSFIPKKSFDDMGKVSVKTPHNILSLIAGTMIIITLVVAGGVFGYKILLNKKIEAISIEVSNKEKTFDYGTIESIVLVDKQLKSAETLLKNHVAVSNVFTILEDATIKNVRFLNFSFTYLSPTKVALSMKGEARSFGAVARQAEVFSTATTTAQYFKDTLFSDFNLDQSGNVTFSFLATLDPRLTAYKPEKNINTLITPPVAPTSTASSTQLR